MESGKIEESSCQFRVFTTGELKSDFIPWSVGDRGQQSFIKLRKANEIAYLYSGMGAILQAEVQKALMRLVNEGWLTQGEVHISFEGTTEPDVDVLLERDNITLELGASLLPLVDPYQGAPLLDRLNMIREEIAHELGFVIPSVKVKDNMKIPPNQYLVRLREAPVASGELYLNRYLAIGTLEQIGGFPGWSTLEPAYKMNAKWIEISDKEKAENSGCIVQGGLNVLLTHLKETVKSNGKSILGLQETHHLLERLSNSHPVVVEEFITDRKKLRSVRKVLQNLLSENVAINDLVTIMEIIGDNLEDLKNVSLMTEHVRRGLARQICWALLGEDGLLRAFTFHSALEAALKSSLRDTSDGVYLLLPAMEEEKLTRAIRNAISAFGQPLILITEPSLRIYLWNLLGDQLPSLTLLSTAEIPREVRVSMLGEIKLENGAEGVKEEEREKGSRKKKRGKFWSKEP